MSEDSTPELKPCPFCSKEARLRFQRLEGTVARAWYVECWVCESGTKFKDSAVKAAETWNTRADLAAPDAAQWRDFAREALADSRGCDECDAPAVWERSDDPETYWYACDKHTGTGIGWRELKTVRLALRLVAATQSEPDAVRQARREAVVCDCHWSSVQEMHDDYVKLEAQMHEWKQKTLDQPSPTEEEAEAVLRAHGTSGKEVVNGFIERLLRERSEFIQEAQWETWEAAERIVKEHQWHSFPAHELYGPQKKCAAMILEEIAALRAEGEKGVGNG